MHVIGLTGGVGSGKTVAAHMLAEILGAELLISDELGHIVMQKGQEGYRRIIQTFGTEILDGQGEIVRDRLSKVVFGDTEALNRLNQIIHPAVKQYIRDQLAVKKQQGQKVCVVEAALLLEDHYDEICDELWYIFTAEEIRKERLMESRGYSEEKIQHIFESQLKEEIYRKYCKTVIDNNGDLNKTYGQIDKAFERLMQ